jgi:hypothetical protein
MRSAILPALIMVLGLCAVAQAAPLAPPIATKPVSRATPPPSGPCCVRKVWDARGHEVGDLIDYDERFQSHPLPTRTVPAPGTVYHSQWTESGACSPYPAPGYTYAGGFGGYRMHRIQDLYAKFTRPFSINY